jgi:hypothetical protein
MKDVKIIFGALCEGIGVVVIIAFALILVFGGEWHIKVNFYTAVDLFKKIFK